MNDLQTGQRTFFIGVSALTDGSVTEVPFVDSAGNNIRCNYIEIRGMGTGAINGSEGVFAAELSGVPHVGDFVTNELSAAATTVNTSGICGFGGVVGAAVPSTTTWHGSNGQVATGVKIHMVGGSDVNLAITYGNLYPLNSMRLEQSYDSGL